MLKSVDDEGEEQLSAERQAKRRDTQHYKGTYLQFRPSHPCFDIGPLQPLRALTLPLSTPQAFARMTPEPSSALQSSTFAVPVLALCARYQILRLASPQPHRPSAFDVPASQFTQNPQMSRVEGRASLNDVRSVPLHQHLCAR